jgi:hypothetical protein
MKRALIVVVAATALAGCGSSNKNNGGDYPKTVIADFTKNCVASGGGTNDVKDRCKCVIGKIQDRVDFADFKKADDAIRNGTKPDKAVIDDENQAVSDCRKEG